MKKLAIAAIMTIGLSTVMGDVSTFTLGNELRQASISRSVEALSAEASDVEIAAIDFCSKCPRRSGTNS